jgi:hypothetical protein
MAVLDLTTVFEAQPLSGGPVIPAKSPPVPPAGARASSTLTPPSRQPPVSGQFRASEQGGQPRYGRTGPS